MVAVRVVRAVRHARLAKVQVKTTLEFGARLVMVRGGLLLMNLVHVVVDQVAPRDRVRRGYVCCVLGLEKGIHSPHRYSAVIFVQTTQEREAYAPRSFLLPVRGNSDTLLLLTIFSM